MYVSILMHSGTHVLYSNVIAEETQRHEIGKRRQDLWDIKFEIIVSKSD